VTKWCGADHTTARASGRCRWLGSTRGAMTPPVSSHTSSRGLEDTASAPDYGWSGWRRRSTRAWRRRTVTLATEGFGTATRGSARRIECGGGVDPWVQVLCNQWQRPGWPGLDVIRAGGSGGGGGIGGESRVPSEERRGMGGVGRVWPTGRPGRSALVSQPGRPIGPVKWAGSSPAQVNLA
jgi:hypothetical protein